MMVPLCPSFPECFIRATFVKPVISRGLNDSRLRSMVHGFSSKFEVHKCQSTQAKETTTAWYRGERLHRRCLLERISPSTKAIAHFIVSTNFLGLAPKFALSVHIAFAERRAKLWRDWL